MACCSCSLVMLAAALDPTPLRLVVELLLRATFGPVRPRAQASAPARRDVPRRGARRRACLALAGPLLVHGCGSDLLRALRGGAALLCALLDVLVLALALVTPCFLWHVDFPPWLVALGGIPRNEQSQRATCGASCGALPSTASRCCASRCSASRCSASPSSAWRCCASPCGASRCSALRCCAWPCSAWRSTAWSSSASRCCAWPSSASRSNAWRSSA